MATINIEMTIKNASNQYDTLYPKTLGSLISGSVSQADNATNSTNATNLTGTIDASKVSSGTFSTARIPNLSASKITSGTLPLSRGGTGYTSWSSIASAISPYLSSSSNYTIGKYTGDGQDTKTLTLSTDAKVLFIIPFNINKNTGSYSDTSGAMGYGSAGAVGISLYGSSSSTNYKDYFPVSGCQRNGNTYNGAKPLIGYETISWNFSNGNFTLRYQSGSLWDVSSGSYATNAGADILNYNGNTYCYIYFT